MASRVLFVVYDNGSYDNQFPMGVGALSAVLKQQEVLVEMDKMPDLSGPDTPLSQLDKSFADGYTF